MTTSKETIEEIPRTDPTNRDTPHEWEHLTSLPISHHKVSSGLYFQESYQTLFEDFNLKRRSVIWQESERICQMQFDLEDVPSIAALISILHRQRMIPFLDWRLLQRTGHREKMQHYAKRVPAFVASLSIKDVEFNRNFNQMISSFSKALLDMCQLCNNPVVLCSIHSRMSYDGREVKVYGLRLDISIIEAGHITRIPRYRLLHDPTHARPPTIPPPRSVPASTLNPSSQRNQQLVPVPMEKSPPKFGPKPPPISPLANSKPGSGVSRIPRHKNTLSRTVRPLSSSSSKDLTLSQRLDELTCIVKRQELLLESMARRLG
ncbi:hypothetical protein BDN72DRAFT_966173 [Pluteus cervinus]|uniref:Uncharacterized protein n=1 Tax=Pluteus cervinus TaxID=181527 RepID=A0ACD2ZZM8_9AGAR|nr:hypothetical protein BDN72DRAFT_966173 [Pluteus cervinus]